LALESEGPEYPLPPDVLDDALELELLVVGYCVTRLSCGIGACVGAGGGDEGGPGVDTGGCVAPGLLDALVAVALLLVADGEGVAAACSPRALDVLLAAVDAVSLDDTGGAPGTPAMTGML
jgi:hypothetical protein